MRKGLRYFFFGLGALLILVPGILLGPFVLRVQHHRANLEFGYYADFYLYVSPAAKQMVQNGKTATLLIQPNNSGTNSDDPEVHRKDAWWMAYGRHFLADDLGVVLLVPAILRPSEDWHIYTHALDRDVLTTARTDLARLDLQLLSMIDVARSSLEEQGISVHEKFLLQGYSASGMFANRFTALHPNRVMAIAAGSPGGWPIAPVAMHEAELLPYPVGIGDLELLTGQPFDSTSYRVVPQLIVMGSLDENDSVDFSDGWDKGAMAQVDRLFGDTPLERWDDAEALYQAAGTNARFQLVTGVGHDRKALQSYSTAFFKEVLNEQ